MSLDKKNSERGVPETKTIEVVIDGMHCQSCEVLVERSFRSLPGVRKVDVKVKNGRAVLTCDAGCTLTPAFLEDTIREHGYTVRSLEKSTDLVAVSRGKPSVFELIALVSIVYLVWVMLSNLGLLDQTFALSSQVTFSAAIVLGLVAGSSSCLAVAGGLLLSSSAVYRDRYSGTSAFDRLRPALFFVFGRILAYGLFGALIGFLGASFIPSPFVTAALMVLAAVYMIVMGLDMLGLAPPSVKAVLPRMPKALSHKIIDAQGKEHPFMPLLLGGATFFLPCGFTQALQIYALTTGSAIASGLVLAGFALGTAPALLTLGWASSSLKGPVGYWFFRFSGVIVIILGLSSMRNGLIVSGFDPATFVPGIEVANAEDPNVEFDGETQIIKMKIGLDPAYSPSDHYTVRAGIPVRMEIAGRGTGCRSLFQIPGVQVSIPLNQDINIVEFTPTKSGTLVFSCSMGMFDGRLTVI